jgi:hypothetical protein
MDADPKSTDFKKDAPRRSMERLVQQFGAVWVASQDGMAAIGATRKDALAGLADCIKCKTSLQIIHTWVTFRGGQELVPKHVENLTAKTLAPFRLPNDKAHRIAGGGKQPMKTVMENANE